MKINIAKKRYLLVLVLLISIGFAFLSTNLNISGLVGFKESNWDVHFDNIQIINNDINSEMPTIDDEKTSITFSGTFKQPGEVFEFSIDVVNDGTIDAMLNSIVKIGINSENTDYLNYEVKYYDDKEISKYDLLKRKSKTRINIKGEYKYDISSVPNLGQQNFSLTLEYVSATENAVERDNSFITSEISHVKYLNNVKSNSLLDFKIYGNTAQYNGRNLLYLDNVCGTKNGIDYTWNGNELTLNGTATKDTDIYNFGYWSAPDKNMLRYLPPGSYKISLISESTNRNLTFSAYTGYDYSFGFSRGNSSTFTTSKGIYYSLAYLSLYNGSSFNNDKYYLQVEKINSTEGFEKHENISFTNKQEVASVTGESKLTISGKNLLNYNNLGKYAIQRGISVDDTGHIYSTITDSDSRLWGYDESNWFVTLEPGTYTLSLYFSNQSTVGDNYTSVYTQEKKRILTLNNANTDFVSGTFTLKKELSIGILVKGYDAKYHIQLEKGDISTDWESYKSKDYPISLGNIELNSIYNKRDYIYKNGNKWLVHKETDKLYLSDLTGWVKGTKGVFYRILHNSVTIKSSWVIPLMYCNGFHVTNMDSLNKYSQSITFATGNFINFVDTENNFTVSEMMNYLKENNIYIVYQLEKSIDTEINDNNLVNQLNAVLEDNFFDGINYVSFDSNIYTDIDFNYISK